MFKRINTKYYGRILEWVEMKSYSESQSLFWRNLCMHSLLLKKQTLLCMLNYNFFFELNMQSLSDACHFIHCNTHIVWMHTWQWKLTYARSVSQYRQWTHINRCREDFSAHLNWIIVYQKHLFHKYNCNIKVKNKSLLHIFE